MATNEKLKYQTCREMAGLTQEQAAELLGVGVSTLTRYENGHYPVPQDIVAAMVRAYRVPKLAWWHVLRVNPDLIPWLPEPPKIATHGDLILQHEFAEDDLSEIREGLKDIFRDGKITQDEKPRLERKADRYRAIASKLMEKAGYLDELALRGDE